MHSRETIVKTFAAVGYQRKTRDEIDAITKGMSFEKRKQQTRVSVLALKDRLQKLKKK